MHTFLKFFCFVLLPDSDKEEPSGSKQGGLVVPPKQMSAGLASLVASYGSVTESDSDEEPQGELVMLLCILLSVVNSLNEMQCLSNPSQMVLNVRYLNPLSHFR